MEQTKKTNNSALAILTTLFFMWGFITCMNDILIPYLKGVFDLNHTQAMLVQSAFFGAYFIGSLIYFFISSKIGDPINKIGYKNGIIIGLITSAIGTALFYPAASLVSYPFFLSALFILGLGLTILQIAANPYVAIIGSPETASGRLNLSQGFNSLGTTIAPLIGGYLIFTVFHANDGSANSVKTPYLIFSMLFIVLAIFIKTSRLPAFTNQDTLIKGAGALKFKHLVFGIIAIFMYVGAEVSIGSNMIAFLGMPEIASLNESIASSFVSIYWGGLMIGRFCGAISLSQMNNTKKTLLMLIVPIIAFLIVLSTNGIEFASTYGIFLFLNIIVFRSGKFLPARTLFLFAIAAASLVLLTIFTSGHLAMWSLIAVGLFNSIMWSNIFTLSIDGLGDYTSQGSSLLVMAILGGAVLPLLQGVVADSFGLHNSFWVPFFAYLYIIFYGLYGYKAGRKDYLK